MSLMQWLTGYVGVVAMLALALVLTFCLYFMIAVFWSMGCWAWYGPAHMGPEGTAWLFRHCG